MMFGIWQEHVESWTGEGCEDGNRKILVLKYEDILSQPVESLINIARFLGLSVEDDEAEKIVWECSRKKMLEKEKFGNRRIIDHGEQYFIGPGKNGTWKSKISEYGVEQIECFANPTMRKFGYL